MEHPAIKEVNQKGFIKETPTIDHWGIDAMDNEILVGDSIIETPYGEVLLEENLEDYLIERLGFVFKKAE